VISSKYLIHYRFFINICGRKGEREGGRKEGRMEGISKPLSLN